MATVQIELTPEQQTLLQKGATEQGLGVPEYLRALIVTSLMRFDSPIHEEPEKPRRTIMELHGLGADAWRDEKGQLVDAQQYVNELREEWEDRPQ